MIAWPAFRIAYEAAVVAALPRLSQAIWRNVADDLERLAGVRMLADVPGCLARFEAALLAEEVDRTSLAIYLATVRDAVSWARGEGLLSTPLAA